MRFSKPRIAIILILLLMPVFCGRPDPGPAAPRPDIVLFVIDTLRADHLSSYGYARGTSPNLDRFASNGLRCALAFAQSSWTAPSMTSMMTSRFVASDFKKMPADKSVVTLAERLKRIGYRTCGMQFNVLLGLGSGFERGFDEYLLEPSLKEVLDRVEEKKSTQPRFLYFHFVEPHDPYKPSKEFDVFEPATLPPARVDEFRAMLAERTPKLPDNEISKEAREAAKSIAAEVARYDGEIRAIDSKFGDLLTLLEKRGTLANTIVIVASDHGECLWEHREALSALTDKTSGKVLTAFKQTHNTLLNEELLHVPLIIGGPGVPRGIVHTGLVANVDIVPTVLELIGTPIREGVDGTSLVPALPALMNGQPAPGREIVLANTSIFTSARSAGGDKVILPWDSEGPDQVQCFDLRKDPRERSPLRLAGDAFTRLEKAILSVRKTGLQAREGEALIDEQTAERLRQMGYPGGDRGGGSH